MTVQVLLNNIDSREITEWSAFFQIENERHEETRKNADAKRAGKVMAKDSKMLSEAIKMQLQPKKG